MSNALSMEMLWERSHTPSFCYVFLPASPAAELRHAYLQRVFMQLPYPQQRMHHDVSGLGMLWIGAGMPMRAAACRPGGSNLAPSAALDKSLSQPIPSPWPPQEVLDMHGEQAWALMRQFVAEEVAGQRGGGGGGAPGAGATGGGDGSVPVS